MTDSNQRALAETVFEREQRREKEISDAKWNRLAVLRPSRTCIV